MTTEPSKRPSVKDVTDFVMTCLNEAEADGYQQQGQEPIHTFPITFGYKTAQTIWLSVGDDIYQLRVSKVNRR